MCLFSYLENQASHKNNLPYTGDSKSDEVISSKDDEVFRILWNAYLCINVSLLIGPSR